MSSESVTALSAAELRAMADAQETADKPKALPAPEFPAASVMISPSDLRELLNLQQRFNDLEKQLVESKKLAPAGVGTPICMCKACDPANIIQPGDPGYKEVKDKETGALLPYMPAGTHAA